MTIPFEIDLVSNSDGQSLHHEARNCIGKVLQQVNYPRKVTQRHWNDTIRQTISLFVSGLK